MRDENEACESAAKCAPSVTVSRLWLGRKGDPRIQWSEGASGSPTCLCEAPGKLTALCGGRGSLFMNTCIPLFRAVFTPWQGWEARLSCALSYKHGPRRP